MYLLVTVTVSEKSLPGLLIFGSTIHKNHLNFSVSIIVTCKITFIIENLSVLNAILINEPHHAFIFMNLWWVSFRALVWFHLGTWRRNWRAADVLCSSCRDKVQVTINKLAPDSQFWWLYLRQDAPPPESRDVLIASVLSWLYACHYGEDWKCSFCIQLNAIKNHIIYSRVIAYGNGRHQFRTVQLYILFIYT